MTVEELETTLRTMQRVLLERELDVQTQLDELRARVAELEKQACTADD
jgi:hypothetical protein